MRYKARHLLLLRKIQATICPGTVLFSSANTPRPDTVWLGGFAGPDAMFPTWDQISPNPGSYANPGLKEAWEWNKRKSPWSRLLIKAAASSRWAAPPTARLLACHPGQGLGWLMTIQHRVHPSGRRRTGCCPIPHTQQLSEPAGGHAKNMDLYFTVCGESLGSCAELSAVMAVWRAECRHHAPSIFLGLLEILCSVHYISAFQCVQDLGVKRVSRVPVFPSCLQTVLTVSFLWYPFS